MTDRIRAVVVDDEPAGRANVRQLAGTDSELELIGEYEQADEIVPAVTTLRPDLLFLDVDLSGESGLDALHRIPEHQRPAVVFVTAFDTFASQAFDLGAVDYLLKPYSDVRFHAAVARVRARLARSRGLVSSLDATVSVGAAGTRLAIRCGNSVRIVAIDDVEWVEAAGDYVRLHTDGGPHVLRSTMAAMEQRFQLHSFVRVHRCTLVNMVRVTEVRGLANGEWEVVLRSGTRRRITEAGRAALGRALRVML